MGFVDLLLLLSHLNHACKFSNDFAYYPTPQNASPLLFIICSKLHPPLAITQSMQ
jgi:hypothetical protein